MGSKSWLITLLAGLIVLGITEHSFFSWHPHFQIFLKEVGFAAIIASVLGATIDRYQREEFVRLVNREREDLKRDVFLYAYGIDVPEQIRNEMKDKVLKQPLHRSNLRLSWEFSVADKPDFLRLEKQFTFTVYNKSAQTEIYHFAFQQITAAEEDILEETKFVRLRMEDRDGKIHEFMQGDLTEVRDATNPHSRSLSKDFKIRPDESLVIHYEIDETRRIYTDEFYSPSQPTTGITLIDLRVNRPLELDISGACKAKRLEEGPAHDPPKRYAWKISEGIFPYQGIAISWSPAKKERQTSQPTEMSDLPKQTTQDKPPLEREEKEETS